MNNIENIIKDLNDDRTVIAGITTAGEIITIIKAYEVLAEEKRTAAARYESLVKDIEAIINDANDRFKNYRAYDDTFDEIVGRLVER